MHTQGVIGGSVVATAISMAMPSNPESDQILMELAYDGHAGAGAGSGPAFMSMGQVQAAPAMAEMRTHAAAPMRMASKSAASMPETAPRGNGLGAGLGSLAVERPSLPEGSMLAKEGNMQGEVARDRGILQVMETIQQEISSMWRAAPEPRALAKLSARCAYTRAPTPASHALLCLARSTRHSTQLQLWLKQSPPAPPPQWRRAHFTPAYSTVWCATCASAFAKIRCVSAMAT